MKTFLQEHKRETTIGIIVFFSIILLFFIIFFIVPSFGNNKYGDRLTDINKHKISSTKIDKIKKELKNKDEVEKVVYDNEGRILSFIITFADDTNIDVAKQDADIVIKNFSKKDLKYYDIEIYLKSDSDGFPNIGYHAKGSDTISWGNAGETA